MFDARTLFVGSDKSTPGGPRVPLKVPDPRTVKCITGNGNCLFWSFSYIVMGLEDQHWAIRLLIVHHMTTITHLLLGAHIPNGFNIVEDYIRDTRMDRDSTWGINVLMFTLAHLLNTSIFLYNTWKMAAV